MNTHKTSRTRTFRQQPFCRKSYGALYKLLSDPKRGSEFLKKARILDENEQPTAPYRHHRAQLQSMKSRRRKNSRRSS